MTFAKARIAAIAVFAASFSAPDLAPRLAAAQPTAEVHPADATAIDRSAQRRHCEAQLHRLKQNSGLADGQSDQAFMTTCLADVDPVATLPGSGALMNAPAGATGICKDGTYAASVKREGACSRHGGLAQWFGD